MIIKTKKYQLPIPIFVKIAFKNIFIKFWWVNLIYIFLNLFCIILPSWWWFIGSTILLGIYHLFWYIQFVGMRYVDSPKFSHLHLKLWFEKVSYEINSQQIIVKYSMKEGTYLKWDKVQRIIVTADSFILFFSTFQITHLPHKIFNSPHEIKFMELIIKQKKLYHTDDIFFYIKKYFFHKKIIEKNQE